jgi:hypothetical protein
MGTVCGLRTRRYHGLLVPAVAGASARRLSRVALDPVLTLPSGACVRLGVHEWAGGAVAPAGHTLLESFDLDEGLPRWRWRVVVERELAIRHGSASVAVVHRLLAGGPVSLALEALVTWRDAHGERHAGQPPAVEHHDGGVVVEGSFRLRGPGWSPAGGWYRGVHARLEADRGLAARSKPGQSPNSCAPIVCPRPERCTSIHESLKARVKRCISIHKAPWPGA